VASGVTAFTVYDPSTVWWISPDGQLNWTQGPSYTFPPQPQWITKTIIASDIVAVACNPGDDSGVLALKADGTLWYGNVGYAPWLVANDVRTLPPAQVLPGL